MFLVQTVSAFFRPLLRRLSVAIDPSQANLSAKPIEPHVLQRKLKNGRVKFFFKKKDGTLRLAYGTLKMKYVPAEKHPQGLREPSPKQVVFFDLMKKDWRSVSCEQEIFLQ